jgi:hypothetical protein
MEESEQDLVNLRGPQVDQITTVSVPLRSSQEDIRMLPPTLVDQIQDRA